MGQKVNANAIRMGINQTWNSKWYAKKKDISTLIKLDHDIRVLLFAKLSKCMVDFIGIERLVGMDHVSSFVKIKIHSARPGMIIGRKGEGINQLNQELRDRFKHHIMCEVVEIKKPDLNAQIVATVIKSQLEQRTMYRRCMQRAIKNAMFGGAMGIKISISGRLNGAEMARTEWLKDGNIPLQTFRANIRYGFAEAHTIYGVLGIKVWVCTESIIATTQDIS
jgi:small subunit ribosomal protein S3